MPLKELTDALSAAQPYFIAVAGTTITAVMSQRNRRADGREKQEDKSYARMVADLERSEKKRLEYEAKAEKLEAENEATEAALHKIRADMEARDGELRRRGFASAEAAFVFIDQQQAAIIAEKHKQMGPG